MPPSSNLNFTTINEKLTIPKIFLRCSSISSKFYILLLDLAMESNSDSENSTQRARAKSTPELGKVPKKASRQDGNYFDGTSINGKKLKPKFDSNLKIEDKSLNQQSEDPAPSGSTAETSNIMSQ